MSNKFIRHPGKTPTSSQPAAPATPEVQKPRRMIEEISTQTFEFPNRGGPFAPEPAVPTTQAQPTAPPLVKSHAEIDPAFASISLPSGFQMYDDFKELSTRTLLASHQAKFSRANKEGKLRYAVEGLSAALEPNRSAFALTPGDYYFLLYWQRVNSFSKNPMLITAYCDNEAHNHSVYIGDEVDDPDNPGKKKIVKKDEETLRNEQVMNNTTLETKYADQIDVSDLSITTRYNLGAETMLDVVETTEFIQDTEDVSEEDLFLLKYASFLKRAEGQMNIKEKMAVVATMSPDDIQELDEYIKRVTDYGVEEYATIKCKGCGASVRVKISLDALTFLPSRR